MQAQERSIQASGRQAVTLLVALWCCTFAVGTRHTLERQAHPGAGVPGSAHSALSRFAHTKVFVLNVSEVAAELGLPTCSEDLFVTDPEALIVLPNPALVPNLTANPPEPPPGHEWIYPYASSPHYNSQNAGPWYVLQTLRNSGSSVETIDEADVVYVYDYCYHMRALADHHAQKHWWLKDQYNPERTVGKHLMSSYRAMMVLPRWRRSGGADFVFFHAHPGFEWDDVDVTTELQSLLCNDFQWATMVVVEQGQRWRCPTFTPRSTILAPYASTEVVSSLDSGVPDEERDVLAFFRGSCDPASEFMGKLFREIIVFNMNKADAGREDDDTSDIDACCSGQDAKPRVACTERNYPLNAMRVQPHRELLGNMTRSIFCLMIPGNSQSSQRLTEAFLTGCIPVFVGPPWHSLPLTQMVDYSAAGVFLNITFTGVEGGVPWWWTHPEIKAQEGLDPRAQDIDRFSPAWWFPDVPASAIVPLTRLLLVRPYLRQMPIEWMDEKQAAVARYRNLFTYSTVPQDPPSASDAIIEQFVAYATFGRHKAVD
ncbi:hypothetical protein WJX81_003745 [Elliptochloris bilobata]|uniref:Exostosin GT47 domain-containing protein n=1 Tax=Elliptochloris bilobata TaxID=381761 RepID=A0AAW1QMP0_9CHLO